jgi:hypothetical protein
MIPAQNLASFGNTAANERKQGALCLLLLLILWQIPIPWYHSHGAEDANGASNASLATHLRRFHQSITGAETNVRFGWHFHAIVPWLSSDDPLDMRDSGGSGQEESRLCDELYRAGTTQDFVLQNQINVASPLNTAITIQSDSFRATVCQRHFLDGFASDLSLPQRLCVFRC